MANLVETTKFLDSIPGIVVNHEGQAQHLQSLGGGAHKAKSRLKEEGSLETEGTTGYLPKWTAQKIMPDLVVTVPATKDAR